MQNNFLRNLLESLFENLFENYLDKIRKYLDKIKNIEKHFHDTSHLIIFLIQMFVLIFTNDFCTYVCYTMLILNVNVDYILIISYILANNKNFMK